MDFGLYEMKIVRNNPSSVKSDPRLTRTNDLSPLGSDLSEVYCIYLSVCGILHGHFPMLHAIEDFRREGLTQCASRELISNTALTVASAM